MVSILGVTSAVLAPDRAAAAQASEPAWPPPITTTSNSRRPLGLASVRSGGRALGGGYLKSLEIVAKDFDERRIDLGNGDRTVAGRMSRRDSVAMFMVGGWW